MFLQLFCRFEIIHMKLLWRKEERNGNNQKAHQWGTGSVSYESHVKSDADI